MPLPIVMLALSFQCLLLIRGQGAAKSVLCLWTWVTVLCQDIGDALVGPGGDTCGLRLSGELR